MDNVIIDEGVVTFSDTGVVPEQFRGKTFIYRRFAWQPVIKAFLFYMPDDKPDYICEMEMDILARGERGSKATFVCESHRNGEKRFERNEFAVHWLDDGTPDIAFSEIDVFNAVVCRDAVIDSVSEGYEDLSIEQFELYAKIIKRYFKNL